MLFKLHVVTGPTINKQVGHFVWTKTDHFFKLFFSLTQKELIFQEKIHQLIFNRRTRGWEEAKSNGKLAEFLGHAAAMVYPGFRRFVLGEGDDQETSDSTNLSRLYMEMVDEGYTIYFGAFNSNGG